MDGCWSTVAMQDGVSVKVSQMTEDLTEKIIQKAELKLK